MALNATVRTFFSDRLAMELRRPIGESGTPRFERDDLSVLFQQAVRGNKRLRASEEDALLQQIRGNNKAIYSLCLYFLANNKHDDARLLSTKIRSTEYEFLVLAAVAADKRQTSLALEQLQRAIERQPRLSKSWFCLGLAYAALGSSDHAVYNLYRAIRINPSNDSLYDDIVTILRPDDARRSVIAQLKERAPQERNRWIAPLDAYFFEPPPFKNETSLEPEDIVEPEEVGSLQYLPPLASIHRVLRDLQQETDTLDASISVSAQDLLKSKTPAQRAQLAASLYRQSKSTGGREHVRWLGNYAFSRAAAIEGGDKNHYLLTFLVCSYYCNSDESIRDVAFRHYIKASGSALLREDPLQAIHLFIREPAGSSTIWAARLVVALPKELTGSSRPVSHRDRVKLGLAFVVNGEESDLSKSYALAALMGREWTKDESDLLDTALSFVSRTISLPQQRDRLTALVDLKEFIARVGTDVFSHMVLEILQAAVARLEHEITTSLREQAPPIRLNAQIDVTPGGVAVATVAATNDGNVEVRNTELFANVDNDSAKYVIGTIESLSSGETATLLDRHVHKTSGSELIYKLTARGTSLGSHFEHSANFVLRVSDPNLNLDTLDNPYLTGMPIPPGNDMFFGRQQELVQISNLLTASRSAHVPFVYGQRRTGKTSLLNRLSVQPAIEKMYEFLLLDCERASGANTVGFVKFIIEEMSFGFSRIDIETPKPADIDADPLGSLRSTLNRYASKFRGRRALIAMDEFESLLGGIRDGHITADILGILRSFMQHHNAFAFIIAGADQLVERARDYASPLFGLSKPIRISYLRHDDVRDLLTKPMRKLVSSDADVVDEIMQLCNGHPYLSQLLCHYVVDHLNEFGRRRLTAIDVDRAADIIIANDDAYFHEIFNDRCSKQDRVVLSAIADLGQRQHRRVTYDAVYELLRAHDYSLTPEHLESLQDRQLLTIDPQSRTCAFWLEMLRRWIVRKHPFEAQRRSSVY